VVATDYRGLGTAGLHPYLVGLAAGRDVLDAARAVDDLPGVATSASTLLWGHSQGGHAALFAAQLAAADAADLTIEGTVAVAPAADLRRLAGGTTGQPPLPGVALLMLGSWASHYGLEAHDVLTEPAVSRLSRLEETCDPNTIVGDIFPEPVVSRPVTEVEPWAQRLAENTPGRTEVSGPVLLVQGGQDELIEPASTAELFRRLCRHDAAVELRGFSQAGHAVAVRALDQVIAWLDHRHAGRSAADECGA
jgi:alpha-beta hydrolase superfamily lysophospholipase